VSPTSKSHILTVTSQCTITCQKHWHTVDRRIRNECCKFRLFSESINPTL